MNEFDEIRDYLRHEYQDEMEAFETFAGSDFAPYYKDTMAIHHAFTDEVWETAHDLASAFGYANVPQLVAGQSTNVNTHHDFIQSLVWLVIEHIAMELYEDWRWGTQREVND
jgi:hypothetical protein